MGRVYLNNAASSYPKPPEVLRAVVSSVDQPPCEPGRSGGGPDPIQACRRSLAELFHVPDAAQVALLPSCTHALNTAILGLVRSSDHAVTTDLEHNSVLRPLAHACKTGATVDFVAPQPDGSVLPSDIRAALRPKTRAVVLAHASNVTGAIQSIEEIAHVVARTGAALVIDAAQSAGCIPIDYARLPGRVYVAFAGHKGLYGLGGTGGLVVPDGELEQTIFGGTGIRSESRFHPTELPLRHEAGTPNLTGIIALRAGVEFVRDRGVSALGKHRAMLVARLRDGLEGIGGVRVAPLPHHDGRAGVVSFSVPGWPPEEVGFALREAFGIELRTGLHCAPRIHAWLGTLPKGSVRASVGAFNTESDVELLTESLRNMVKR